MKVLAFEDTVDIEALLISGGVDTSQIEIKQLFVLIASLVLII